MAAGESIFPERIMFQAQKLKDAREAVRDKVRSGGTFVRPATVLEINEHCRFVDRVLNCKRMRWKDKIYPSISTRCN